MGGGAEVTRGVVRIVAGSAVFLGCWIVQATLGESSMFSMTYVDQGFVPMLLVNVTFWPGWIVTVGMIGSGVSQLAAAEDAAELRREPEFPA